MRMFSPPNTSFLTPLALIMSSIACIRSRRKGHTLIIILAALFSGLILGTVIGAVFAGPETAGRLAAISWQISAIAASINRLMLCRKQIGNPPKSSGAAGSMAGYESNKKKTCPGPDSTDDCSQSPE